MGPYVIGTPCSPRPGPRIRETAADPQAVGALRTLGGPVYR